MELNPRFWRGKRVLVTGHTGFKGGWLCLLLARLGTTVTGYALRPDTNPNFFGAAGIRTVVRSHIGDVRDSTRLERVVRAQEPQIVFHLAAQALVRRSYASPADTFATNVMGTVNVLEAARRCPSIGAVIVVTSDKCYENDDRRRSFREDDRLGGQDPYSASKACAELAAQAWRKSFSGEAGKPRIATVRAGNVLGGGDWAEDRLVPDLIRAAVAGKTAIIRNPVATRPWQHVLDPLAGYLLVAQRLHSSPSTAAGAWNFGPARRDTRTVGWIADHICRRWGNDARWRAIRESRSMHEARRLSLNPSKARRELGWRQRLDAAEAIEWTVDWYKRYAADPQQARRATEDQIELFERRRRK